jgi:uncharacterized membrane protein
MQSEEERVRSAERMKFFTDAVVAIAMTLLILPLLESVTEAVHDDLDTADYLRENSGSLVSFALSFVIIASFWMLHHGLYERLESYTRPLMWINFAWMFTIVWLPVPTALAGSMETEPLQMVLYIGTMLVSSVVMAAAYAVARRSPEIWSDADGPPPRGQAAAVALSVLFAVALALGLVVPALGYYVMFVLFLNRPVQLFLLRRLRTSAPAQ